MGADTMLVALALLMKKRGLAKLSAGVEFVRESNGLMQLRRRW